MTDVCESAQELSELAVDENLKFFKSQLAFVKNQGEHPRGLSVASIGLRSGVHFCCAHRYHSWRAFLSYFLAKSTSTRSSLLTACVLRVDPMIDLREAECCRTAVAAARITMYALTFTGNAKSHVFHFVFGQDPPPPAPVSSGMRILKKFENYGRPLISHLSPQSLNGITMASIQPEVTNFSFQQTLQRAVKFRHNTSPSPTNISKLIFSLPTSFRPFILFILAGIHINKQSSFYNKGGRGTEGPL